MAGLCVLNSERTPRKVDISPLSFIKQIRAIITPLNSLRNDKQISKEITCLNCLQNDKEIREIKTSLNCLSNHKEIRGLSPSPRASMSFTRHCTFFLTGNRLILELRANIEKMQKSQGTPPQL